MFHLALINIELIALSTKKIVNKKNGFFFSYSIVWQPAEPQLKPKKKMSKKYTKKIINVLEFKSCLCFCFVP